MTGHHERGPLKGLQVDQEKLGATETRIDENDLDGLLVQLKDMVAENELDVNFPAHILNQAREILDAEAHHVDLSQLQTLVAEIAKHRDLIANDSPYAEVRAVVDPTDDPEVSANTFRAWFLGLLSTIIFTAVNQFFTLRYPTINIYSLVAQLLSYPCGVFLAQVLPTRKWNLFGWHFTLNPGPFNQKEHMLITVMSNVSFGGANGTAYITYIFQVLKAKSFYNMTSLYDQAGFQILSALSTQLIGYGCAGLTRRFLVYPPSMIFPKCLSTIALNKALHGDEGRDKEVNGWKISRYRFFMYCFVAMFVYYWFPAYIFQALSYFNWINWISPENVKLAIITGTINGMALNPFPTFDWNIVYGLYDPIIYPFYSLLNNVVGMAIASFFIIVPIYFTNVWKTAYFPINSNDVFDNTGNTYDVSKVLNSKAEFDVEAYSKYSPPYLSAGYSIMFMASFAAYLAAIVHIALYNRQEITKGVRALWRWTSARDEHEDVHNRLMQRYREVPEWWYLTILAVSFVFGCIAVAHYDTGMPIWGLVFAIALCLFVQIPYGMIYAITNTEVTNNVIAEFVAGYAIPGKPVANLMFKAFGYIACAQSIQFAADLKLGHYMKIAPRVLFSAQVVATVVGAFVSVGVNAWALANISDVCSLDQPSKFTCAGARDFYTSSVIWGAIGPRRLFGVGQIYNPLLYGFLIGALLPIPFYLLTRFIPRSSAAATAVRYIYTPLVLSGISNLAPYNMSYGWPALVVGFAVNYYAKRRWVGWWEKYAYVFTSAMSCGVAIAAIVIFFAVEYHEVDINWWGNEVSYVGCDDAGCPLLGMPASGRI
ncbi:OPT oligopeptide transporter family [Aspergillus brunneoviolaceus CBS 621.78]|uniref:OPT oligopeptide transporter family n=1 Tax=Aspergillus brunneoviolaceus CBS 621.78 TaxID=1450534 RepID=A0ACD1GL37_9EURO|nr:OPT oligopeptide transporter family [Aspergillus brunneoviolaceus CBS 621.78]RAH49978.1 OPT oligopeptide transporter family [Aspergillus brunneoviolaceus CBS 621.78]